MLSLRGFCRTGGRFLKAPLSWPSHRPPDAAGLDGVGTRSARQDSTFQSCCFQKHRQVFRLCSRSLRLSRCTMLSSTTQGWISISNGRMILLEFFEEFENIYIDFERKGTRSIIEECAQVSSFANGRRIEIRDGVRRIGGLARGLKPVGALLIE